MIDTHAHLNDDKLFLKRDEIIKNAMQAGVTQIFCVGYDLNSSIIATNLANEYMQVYSVVATHPHDAKSYSDEVEKQYEILAKQNQKVVAIGEIGLDYHYDFSPREIQKQVFIKQIKLANRLGLPIVIHTREAWEDTFNILNENKHLINHGGIMHCFEGNLDEAKKAIEMGFYIGFGGSVTFKKNEYLHEILKQIPLSRIVLETDCPYLTPVPFRGKETNEPKFIPIIAQKIAEVLGLTLEEIDKVTSENAKRVYKI